MSLGTTTLVKERFINIGRDGAYTFDPKELKCEVLNQDLR